MGRWAQCGASGVNYCTPYTAARQGRRVTRWPCVLCRQGILAAHVGPPRRLMTRGDLQGLYTLPVLHIVYCGSCASPPGLDRVDVMASASCVAML